jgi:hypothetical protein
MHETKNISVPKTGVNFLVGTDHNQSTFSISYTTSTNKTYLGKAVKNKPAKKVASRTPRRRAAVVCRKYAPLLDKQHGE